MNDSACPHCGIALAERDLRREPVEAAPRRFGLAWPRAYCPQCGTSLRSNANSFLAYIVLFGVGSLLIIVLGSRVATPLAVVFKGGGFLMLLLAPYVARRVHRWRVVL